jgi:hypothetical protein
MRLILALFVLMSTAYAQSKPAYRVGYGLQLKPYTLAPTGTTGNGFLYIKSNDANKIHYKDPSGVDIALGAGGGGTIATTYTAGAVAADATLVIQAGDGGPVLFKAFGAATGSLLKSQTSAAVDLVSFTDDAANTLKSNVANGASAVGLTIDSVNDLANATAKLISFRNGGTERLYLRNDASIGFSYLSAGTGTNFEIWSRAEGGSAPSIQWGATNLRFRAGGSSELDLTSTELTPVSDVGSSLGISVTNRFSVGYMRSVEIGGTSGERPTCTSSVRGRIWITQGGAGVTDSLFTCMKSAADTYAWIAGVTGG